MQKKHNSNKIKSAWWENITAVYITLLLLIPLWFTSSGYTTIDVDKFSFFVCVTVIYILALLIFPLQMIITGEKPQKPSLNIGLPHILILIYFICCVISTVISEWGYATLWGVGQGDGIIKIALYLLVFMLVSQFSAVKWWYIIPLSFTIIVNFLIACMQYAGYNPFVLYPTGYTYHDAYLQYSGAFMGTLGNTNFLSAYLAMAVIILIGCFVISENKKSKFLLIPIFMGIFTMFLCEVSAGIVGLFCVLICCIPWLLSSWKKVSNFLLISAVILIAISICKSIGVVYEQGQTALFFRMGTSFILLVLGVIILVIAMLCPKNNLQFKHYKKVRLGLIIALFACGILSVIALYLLPFQTGTIGEIHEILNGNLDGSFGSSRIIVWQEVAKLIPEHLWFGGGPGTLSLRTDYIFSRYIEDINFTATSQIDTAHNDYLNILVNTGLISLLTYISFLVSVVYEAIKHNKSNGIMILLLSALTYLAQIFFSFTTCTVTTVFWVILGILIATARKEGTSNF